MLPVPLCTCRAGLDWWTLHTLPIWKPYFLLHVVVASWWALHPSCRLEQIVVARALGCLVELCSSFGIVLRALSAGFKVQLRHKIVLRALNFLCRCVKPTSKLCSTLDGVLALQCLLTLQSGLQVAQVCFEQ